MEVEPSCQAQNDSDCRHTRTRGSSHFFGELHWSFIYWSSKPILREPKNKHSTGTLLIQFNLLLTIKLSYWKWSTRRHPWRLKSNDKTCRPNFNLMSKCCLSVEILLKVYVCFCQVWLIDIPVVSLENSFSAFWQQSPSAATRLWRELFDWSLGFDDIIAKLELIYIKGSIYQPNFFSKI